MAGENPPRAPPQGSSAAHAHHRKSRWESSSSAAAAADQKSKPSPNPSATPQNNRDPNKRPLVLNNPDGPSSRPENPTAASELRPSFPFVEPPPPPAYGFHMLERRSIALADGSVRSYFALPPDYENAPLMPRPGFRPQLHGFGLDRPPFPMSPEFLGSDARVRNSGPESGLKRKFGEEERRGRDDGFERQRQQLLQYGNANPNPNSNANVNVNVNVNVPGPSGVHDFRRGEEERAPKNMRLFQENVGKLKHSEVDQNALKKAFLHFVKLIFESAHQRKKYLADGKQGRVPCLPCERSSKEFPDTHSLVMHAYNTDNADSVVDHLAFHKALCILMGWNYSVPPDNSKAYRNFSADDAHANQYDLIMWPPTVLIHNTISGKGRDGRIEGLGNRAMDSILRDLGFASGKSTSLHAREGFLGMHAVKFSGDESGLKEALKLADYFEREKRGLRDWSRVQPPTVGKDDENNPNLVKFDPKSREKKRVFYGHLATVADLDKVSYDIRKKVTIVSMREFRQSQQK
ncbi:uncharacterized protein LOC127249520 [Andrographis paniculata]|uniref:uncharacterized protein LOC127249520 n=1 Tax=Andrographis paniculata TaxID=175694 RepID=UPI0021E7C92A|nr:uncharacterized protein LOC127249520 [Andrographis paniculata]